MIILMSSFSTAYFIFCRCAVASHRYLPSHVVLCSFRRKGAAQDMSNVSETVLASSRLSFPHVHFSETSNDRKQAILTPAEAMVLHKAAVNHLSTGSPLMKCGPCLCQWIWEAITQVNFSPVDIKDATLMEGHSFGILSQIKSLWRI